MREEREFIKELNGNKDIISYVDFFKKDKLLRNKLFAEYLRTEQRPNQSLYARSHFTNAEWKKGWEEIYKNIPETTSTNKIVMAGLVALTEFEKLITNLHNECINLHLSNQLPQEFYTHSISETKIYKSLFFVKKEIEDFNNFAIKNKDYDSNETAIIFAKSIINKLHSLELPELKRGVLKNFVDDVKITSFISGFWYDSNPNAISEEVFYRKYRELKRCANIYISDYLKNENLIDKSKLKSEFDKIIKNDSKTIKNILDSKKEEMYVSPLAFDIFTQNCNEYIIDFIKNETLITKLILKYELDYYTFIKDVAEYKINGKDYKNLLPDEYYDEKDIEIKMLDGFNAKKIFDTCFEIIDFLEEKSENIGNKKNSSDEFNFTNNFDDVSTTNVYDYFNKNLVTNNLLSKKELECFIELAFDKQQKPIQKVTFSSSKKNSTIINIFYKYYVEIAFKPYSKQKKYAELLGDYFIGFETKKVINNFAKGYRKVRK